MEDLLSSLAAITSRRMHVGFFFHPLSFTSFIRRFEKNRDMTIFKLHQRVDSQRFTAPLEYSQALCPSERLLWCHPMRMCRGSNVSPAAKRLISEGLKPRESLITVLVSKPSKSQTSKAGLEQMRPELNRLRYLVRAAKFPFQYEQ